MWEGAKFIWLLRLQVGVFCAERLPFQSPHRQNLFCTSFPVVVARCVDHRGVICSPETYLRDLRSDVGLEFIDMRQRARDQITFQEPLESEQIVSRLMHQLYRPAAN